MKFPSVNVLRKHKRVTALLTVLMFITTVLIVTHTFKLQLDQDKVYDVGATESQSGNEALVFDNQTRKAAFVYEDGIGLYGVFIYNETVTTRVQIKNIDVTLSNMIADGRGLAWLLVQHSDNAIDLLMIDFENEQFTVKDTYTTPYTGFARLVSRGRLHVFESDNQAEVFFVAGYKDTVPDDDVTHLFLLKYVYTIDQGSGTTVSRTVQEKVMSAGFPSAVNYDVFYHHSYEDFYVFITNYMLDEFYVLTEDASVLQTFTGFIQADRPVAYHEPWYGDQVNVITTSRETTTALVAVYLDTASGSSPSGWTMTFEQKSSSMKYGILYNICPRYVYISLVDVDVTGKFVYRIARNRTADLLDYLQLVHNGQEVTQVVEYDFNKYSDSDNTQYGVLYNAHLDPDELIPSIVADYEFVDGFGDTTSSSSSGGDGGGGSGDDSSSETTTTYVGTYTKNDVGLGTTTSETSGSELSFTTIALGVIGVSVVSAVVYVKYIKSPRNTPVKKQQSKSTK